MRSHEERERRHGAATSETRGEHAERSVPTERAACTELAEREELTSRVLPPFTIDGPLSGNTHPGHRHAVAREQLPVPSPVHTPVPPSPPDDAYGAYDAYDASDDDDRAADFRASRPLPPLGDPLVDPLGDPLVGVHCGGYVIESLLGEGGMGRVYLARHPRLGKRAAVKIIAAEHSRNPRNIDRFLQEAKAAALVDHPNLVGVLDAAELPGGRAYLLMPYVEGSSLEELCERIGPLPIELAATILVQLCAGLDAAHRHGIIHRDIKPQNILVGPRQHRPYVVQILDFGIAKLLDPHLAGKFKTHTKVMLGTPGYMAPEQARGERSIDSRADVYAVAVVAYRMLTGRRPYTDEALLPWLEKQATNAPFPRPRELRPDLPPAWDEALMAALTHDRNRRLATTRELAHRLAIALPEGEAMLRELMPQLANAPLPPHAATLDPHLQRDLARRAASEPGPAARSLQRPASGSPRRLAIGTLLLALSIGAGALLARSTRSQGPHVAASAPAPTPMPVSPTASSSLTTSSSLSPTTTAPATPAPSSPATPAPSSPTAQLDAPPAPAISTTPAASTPSPRASSPEPSTSPTTPTTAPTTAAKPTTGLLSLDVVPWAYVWLGKRRLGVTPFKGALPVGRHRLRLTNGVAAKTLTVTISPSRTTVVNESLEGPTP